MTNRVTCPSCGFFAAEAVTPVGDGARTLCYDCAHAVTAHGAELGDILSCDCPREERYPRDYLRRRDGYAPADTKVEAAARRWREEGEARKLKAEAFLGRLAQGADAIHASGNPDATRRGYGKRPTRSIG